MTVLATHSASTTPDAVAMSVVVPSANGFTYLQATLAALTREGVDVPLEIIVVDRCGEPLQRQVAAAFPQVRVLTAAADATIPAMRCQGFDAARGAAVAVLEDHVVVPRGWARAMLDAQRDGAVIGGAVDNAAIARQVDWAAFLCEYSHCVSPAEGPSEWLTGNNVLYPRAVLQRYRSRLSPDKWENHLHDMMRADGVALLCRPDIRVGHLMHYTVREYLRQRYLYARSYAGARVADAGPLRRLAYGAAALALPPVLMQRVVSKVVAARRYRAELVRSLPLIAMFVCAWAAGEAVGAWFGPGDSLQKVC